MKSSLKTALWLLATAALVTLAYAGTMWLSRPAPGEAAGSLAFPSAQAADATPVREEQPTAEKPAQPAAGGPGRPFGSLPAYQTRRTNPGEELYRAGQYEKAIEYWTTMAKLGDIESNFRLGREYLYATSGALPRDPVKARDYFLAAAKLGDPRAMFDLGSIYEYGMGVKVDLTESGLWYKRAADYGHPQGQYNYATMVETGEGAPKDLILAYMYYRLAAAQGFYGVPYNEKEKRPDAKAEVPLQILEKSLTKEQIKEGEAKLAAFKILSGPLKL